MFWKKDRSHTRLAVTGQISPHSHVLLLALFRWTLVIQVMRIPRGRCERFVAYRTLKGPKRENRGRNRRAVRICSRLCVSPEFPDCGPNLSFFVSIGYSIAHHCGILTATLTVVGVQVLAQVSFFLGLVARSIAGRGRT